MNRFAADDAPAFGDVGAGPDGDTEAEQCERLAKVRRDRDTDAVAESLAGVTTAARRGTNTVGPIVEAVRSYATVGEICDALASVWGRAAEASHG